jgi:hypothetical protein
VIGCRGYDEYGDEAEKVPRSCVEELIIPMSVLQVGF